jgi:hypothetical protein
MNEAIKTMLAATGVYYITDPDAEKKRQCVPVYVNDTGEVHELSSGNQLGAKLDPEVFRSDAIVMREPFAPQR